MAAISMYKEVNHKREDMALPKPSEDEMKLFSCPICSETLQSPRILPCLHTFCENCIQGLFLSVVAQKENKDTEFSCPVCRTPVKSSMETEVEKWAASLPKNTTISSMIAVANGDKQECHACQRHKQKSIASFWCKECEENLCEKCNTMHSWLKVTSKHTVIPIENIGLSTSGIDVAVIREKCSIHASRKLETYCLEHDQLCCVLCMILTHNHCIGANAISDMPEFDNPKQKLKSIRAAAENLLKLKEQQLNDFNVKVENAEEEAAKYKETVKCKLDELFQAFTKQLHVFRDEHNSDINIRIRFLKQFVSSIQHWIDTTKIVEDNGTKTQLFVHMETVKQQIKTCVKELNETYGHDLQVNVEFEANEVLERVKTLEQMGKYNVNKETLVGQIQDIYTSCRIFGIRFIPCFEDIAVKKVRKFQLPGSVITCGVFIDNGILMLGDKSSAYKLHLFDINTSSLKSTTSFSGYSKRLCYDKNQKQAFISCHSQKLYTTVVGEEIEKSQEMEFNFDYVGALCLHENYIYVVVEKAVKKFPSTANPSSSDKMSLCFKTNTDSDLGGMNIHNAKIFYTTKDKEIKCTTLNGDVVFCYKHGEMNRPLSLVVLSSGLTLILTVDSLYVLSVDGKKHRKLLAKFDNIKDPKDMWLDINEEAVYVAGGEYVEVFRIGSN